MLGDRGALEAADGDYWASLLRAAPKETAEARYRAAVSRAHALGFEYRSIADIVAREPVAENLRRVEALAAAPDKAIAGPALLGAVIAPSVTVTAALRVYFDEIAPAEISGKSEGQKKKWRDGKAASVAAFVEVVGDKSISELDRDDGRAFYKHFLAQIAPAAGPQTRSASWGNRRVGDMRALFRDYFAHMNDPDRENPFDGLAYRDRTRRARRRPSFSLGWITGHILKPGALAGLNDEARGILLMVADIGARPSEIANLTPSMINLEHAIPHLRIEPRFDPDDPREIKTASSIRVVPLAGLALEVMRRHPGGFPRYKDKEAQLSAALNKFMRENGLLPSPKHTVYSLRHSFEDRMKEARVDEEVRRILMGHALDRPEYGEGGSLALRRDAMIRAGLPFDPSIV